MSQIYSEISCSLGTYSAEECIVNTEDVFNAASKLKPGKSDGRCLSSDHFMPVMIYMCTLRCSSLVLLYMVMFLMTSLVVLSFPYQRVNRLMLLTLEIIVVLLCVLYLLQSLI